MSEAPTIHYTMRVWWCVCPACGRRFLIEEGDMLMVTGCPFCQAKIDYTPLVGATERIQ